MGTMVTCARCKGKGSIRESGLIGPGKEKKCPVCGGAGKVVQILSGVSSTMTINKESNKEESCFARIVVKTDGIWRASQVVDTLSALDGLSTRVAVASKIAEDCETFDYVISNLRALGLLQKGLPDQWDKAASSHDILARTDYVKFISLMRNIGVEVQQTTLGLKFLFHVSDLLDLAPKSSRPEIEHIKMASPGSWSLLLSGLLGTKQAVSLLEKIFDALFFHKSTKTKKEAEARDASANARITEAKAKEQEAKAEMACIKVHKEQTKIMLDYTIAIDSLVASLRNAGFEDKDLKSVLQDKVMADIDILSRYKSIGLIRNISVVSLSRDEP